MKNNITLLITLITVHACTNAELSTPDTLQQAATAASTIPEQKTAAPYVPFKKTLAQLMSNTTGVMARIIKQQSLWKNSYLFFKRSFSTLQDWKLARAGLPSYRAKPPKINEYIIPKEYPKSAVSPSQFTEILDTFIRLRTKQLKTTTWTQVPDNDLYEIGSTSFVPFVQKLLLPEKSTVIVMGDLHGDFFSFMQCLEYLEKQGYINNNLKIKPNTYLLSLGDWADRGMYGVEVVALMLQLYNNNPSQILFTRGNHEDRDVIKTYGFKDELVKKLAFNDTALNKMYKVYDLMPSALFLGAENTQKTYWYIQCVHGSFELGHAVKPVLEYEGSSVFSPITRLDRQKIIHDLQQLEPNQFLQTGLENLLKISVFDQNILSLSELSPSKTALGYLWGDFIFDPNNTEIYQITKSNRIEWGKLITQAKFKYDSGAKHTVRGMLRAHQHSPETVATLIHHGGIFQHFSYDQANAGSKKPIKLNDHFVITFNLTPDSWYGLNVPNFSNATMGILTIEKKFEKVSLVPVQIFVPIK